MKKFLTSFFSDQSGASAAEYALILAIIGVALGGAALALSIQIQDSIMGAADDIANCAAGDQKSCPPPVRTE